MRELVIWSCAQMAFVEVLGPDGFYQAIHQVWDASCIAEQVSPSLHGGGCISYKTNRRCASDCAPQ